MLSSRLCTLVALLLALLINVAVAQSPTPAPTLVARLPARKAGSDAASKTKHGTPSTTKDSASRTSHSSTSASASGTSTKASSTATSTATASSSSSSLSTGAIAGIVVGVVVLVLLVAAGVIFYIWRMRKLRNIQRQSMSVKGTLGGVTPIGGDDGHGNPMGDMYKNVNYDSSQGGSGTGADVEAGAAVLGAAGGRSPASHEPWMLSPAADGSIRGPSVEIDGTERPPIPPKVGIQAEIPQSPVELGTTSPRER